MAPLGQPAPQGLEQVSRSASASAMVRVNVRAFWAEVFAPEMGE
jgi:hypothetical protein